MTLGEKVKLARIKLKLTQAEVAGERITRNMLSCIERGRATPSIETLEYLAERLELPLPYLLSNGNDLFFFKKKERMPMIRSALEAKNYTVAISHIMKIEGKDDELSYILAQCYFELGVTAVKHGFLQSAVRNLSLARDFCERTIYDTRRFECMIPIYLAIAKNVSSPLLEFEPERFEEFMDETVSYEFYRYFILDFTYPFKHPQLKAHAEAKRLIKERKYSEALTVLSGIEETKSQFEHNSYIMFGVYSDLELCYKQLFDFENAYRYASKRISLMEGFQS
ncbi:MAG: helix-turn-helix transcriptional regulator [Clostridia bacterium]|nr:helix-turn-helix transcriptional regulator [Clostridia bacterium]